MDTTRYGSILRARKAELERRLNRIEEDFVTPRNPDDDDRAVERNNDEVLEELGETGERELAAIDAALHRIAAGTFGICARCGQPIAEKRLDAVPHTSLCQTCAGEVADEV
ncbi:TraR/DksA family transcriptional regulator [Neorhizobium galegae]|uniref:TraR/DksA family transcriptional regulator n=1 Tax=Neorhizobium galegae TaxID=399 RepID=UPI000621825E|nr:TraR/DksA family transcriptional regulator [Neorhizobium galegae]CDZ30319.1 DnaK suppressor protein [Neorhizobium galegae bv. officinalis]KAA9386335.1 TraR/DksA family transcriptional regulator [Neorhizobium galegae]KAB1112809.1 TraR/DksA family transcriptional regulator [Neorhizobium galegae]MCM2500742.1 TraR/DksA family transcriptional regulator [Neorhizobium galegae]MCQ1770701.1 TraR/DksA family transcriptional regulator [Neorhizobium galegae]